MKFKVGDFVICKDWSGGSGEYLKGIATHPGHVFEVTKIDGICLFVDGRHRGVDHGCFAKRFELAYQYAEPGNEYEDALEAQELYAALESGS